jgi:aspartyl-tRNA(Asn)/glutamyl-tRNA(Gln) amidotransferase subunit A
LEDATVVQRLRTAGAHLCGSLHTSEFGFGLHGSQAGEACRQQAADVELVLDLMGESRLAARRAGVCGFKPSYGLVSRFGLIGLIPSMECCGILSGPSGLCPAGLQAVAGQDNGIFRCPTSRCPTSPRGRSSRKRRPSG